MSERSLQVKKLFIYLPHQHHKKTFYGNDYKV